MGVDGSFDLVGGLFTSSGRCYLETVFAVGEKHAVEVSEVGAGFWHQGG